MIHVTFQNSNATRIKPLHGLNCGPRSSTLINDTTDAFRKAGIPIARLAEIDPPYGSGEYIDVSCIFKDPQADPENPESYDFQQTDLIVSTTISAGLDVIYRLGVSEEPGPIPVFIHPPKDYSAWSSICEHIILHYNAGWKNGFNYGIRYWEIWNEPELIREGKHTQWTGTNEDFFKLYCTVAKHLRKCFGDSIRIGGYSACSFLCEEGINQRAVDFLRSFLQYVKQESAPLDFFSWHFYGSSLASFLNNVQMVRAVLDESDFEEVESILSSWDIQTNDSFTELPGETVAAFNAGVMIIAQENGVSLATNRDGLPAHPCCRLFERFSKKPTRAFYAFEAWQTLYRLGISGTIKTTENETVLVASANNGNEAAILVSGYGSKEQSIVLFIQDFGLNERLEIKTYVIDSESEGCEARFVEKVMNHSGIKLRRNINENTVLLIKIKRLNQE